MATIEQAEQLRDKTGVSFADAKEALEQADGDMLDAVIWLEQHGKIAAPVGGGTYTNSGSAENGGGECAHSREGEENSKEQFKEIMKKIGGFILKIIEKGNKTFIDAVRGDETFLSCPLTALIILLIFFFWVVVPVMIIALFFGVHYRVHGDTFEADGVNDIMESASDAVENLKKSIMESKPKS